MSGTHLTTSRINRVLRPLRTKCDKLASSALSPGVRVTYSTRTKTTCNANTFAEDAPPLTILQPPELLQARLQLDLNSRKHVELSRSIYAVRDAFKNVVQVAFWSVPDDRRGSITSPPSTMLSLSALCGVVVGLELGNYQDDDEDEDGGDSEEACEGVFSYSDELYDEVPLHVRKWTMVTHALQLVLRLCPHHPTLLDSLLDVCLAQKQWCHLIPHCETLLKALLTVSLASPSNPNAVSPLPPPICHIAHVSYLVELKTKWCNTGFGSQRSFINILLRLLPSASPEAWTSKALAKLARDVSAEDFTCLIYFATGLVRVIITTSRGGLEKQPNARKLDLLMKWCHSILDHLMFIPEVDDNEDVCLAVLDLVLAYFNSRHPFHPPSAELEDIMTCIITWCLASLPPSFSERDLDHVVRILTSASPSRSVYSSLVSRIFSLSSEDELSAQSVYEIHSFTASLRFNRLCRLEVHFIRQTLIHLEKSLVMTWGHEPEFEELKRELVKNLRGAEAKIEGWESESPRDPELSGGEEPTLHSPPPPGLKKRRTDSNDKLRFRVQKRQRGANRKAPPRMVVIARPREKKSKSTNYKRQSSDVALFHDELVATRCVARHATYDESDPTPEAAVDGGGDTNEDGSDDDEHSGVSWSLQSSSSDDVLDLFAFPDTSPVVVRFPKR